EGVRQPRAGLRRGAPSEPRRCASRRTDPGRELPCSPPGAHRRGAGADRRVLRTPRGIQHHAGRHLLPVVRMGDRLIGLRLPLTPDTIGATFRVTAALGGPAEPLDIGTTDYWPARAAGFGLSRMENGAAAVTPPPRRL